MTAVRDDDGAPLLLRRRVDADLAIILSWIPDATALRLFTGPVLDWPPTVDAFRAVGERADGYAAYALALEPGGPIVGHFDLTGEDARGEAVRVGRVIVDPARRGRGLAAPLMRHAIAEARGLGARELRLNVIAGNSPAIRTYERLGFAAGPRPEHIPADVIPMRRAL